MEKSTGRKLALKLAHKKSKNARFSLLKEGQLLSQCKQENIICVFESDTETQLEESLNFFQDEDTSFLGEVDLRNLDIDLKGSPQSWKIEQIFYTLKLELGHENLRSYYKRRIR